MVVGVFGLLWGLLRLLCGQFPLEGEGSVVVGVFGFLWGPPPPASQAPPPGRGRTFLEVFSEWWAHFGCFAGAFW